jgi:prevent-host-death family protein
MQEISKEEKRYLEGSTSVNKELYTGESSFEIDRKRFLKEGRLITVRPHSRFIEFPLHRHNYIEIMYVCKGTITHCLDGQELVMKKGDMLLLNQHVQHAVKRADYDDIGINFIAPPEFFDIPLQMLKENNVLADFLVNMLRQKNPVSHYLLFRLEENRAIENLMENMIASMLDDVQNEDSINQYSMGIVFLHLLRHIKDLRNTSEISEIAHKEQEPIFITKNGYSDMVVMSSELYDRFARSNRIDQAIYESEKEMQEGGEAIDLDDAFHALNKKYYG